MKHSVIVVVDEAEFGGVMYDEGENLQYDKYTNWLTSNDATNLVNDIKKLLAEYSNDEVLVDGGTLLHPNGIMLGTAIYIPAEMAPVVQDWITSKVDALFNKYTRTCPAEMSSSVRVESD